MACTLSTVFQTLCMVLFSSQQLDKLIQVGKGLLADTPGFNVPSLTNLSIGNLQACFPEIERRLEEDRYNFALNAPLTHELCVTLVLKSQLQFQCNIITAVYCVFVKCIGENSGGIAFSSHAKPLLLAVIEAHVTPSYFQWYHAIITQ